MVEVNIFPPRGRGRFLVLFALLLCVFSNVNAQKKTNYRHVPVLDSAIGYASFYSNKFIGKKTANGEKFSQKEMTCAHNTLPFGTRVKVTNLKNGKSVVVRVNDRLHHRNPRLVDLTTLAAKNLGFHAVGIVRVKVEVLRDEKAQPDTVFRANK